MNKQKKKWLIGRDVTEYLSYAHMGYLGIILVIYIIAFFVLGRLEAPLPEFLNFSYSSASIYMIIMGAITATYFFPMYIQLGVSRKQTFFGNMIGALGGASLLILFTVVISLALQLVFRLFGLTVTDNQMLLENFITISDESSVSEFLLGASFLSGLSRWAITLFSFWVTILINYTVGWMVGTGFYRGEFFKGIGTILLGILVLFARDIFWDGSALPFLPEITLEGDPLLFWVISLVVSVVIFSLLLWIIRKMTKKMPIKL